MVFHAWYLFKLSFCGYLSFIQLWTKVNGTLFGVNRLYFRTWVKLRSSKRFLCHLQLAAAYYLQCGTCLLLLMVAWICNNTTWREKQPWPSYVLNNHFRIWIASRLQKTSLWYCCHFEIINCTERRQNKVCRRTRSTPGWLYVKALFTKFNDLLMVWNSSLEAQIRTISTFKHKRARKNKFSPLSPTWRRCIVTCVSPNAQNGLKVDQKRSG